MATYNGHEYIKEQIDSIISQTYQNWDLYIRDDGSTDDTLEIVKNYEMLDGRIHLISYPSEDHGACLNFYNLLRAAKNIIPAHDYYLLSDQDDIWEKNKIEVEIATCDAVDGKYVLAYSDLSLMSSDGTIINGKMSDQQNINLSNPNDIFFNQIFVWGNTICINRKLLEFMNIPDDISNSLSHDHYLAFYAAAFGKVVYIDEPLVRYRRHEDNVSGLPPKYNIFSAISHTIQKGSNIICEHAKNYNNVIYFIENAPYKTKQLDDIHNALRTGGIEAKKIIDKYDITPGSNFCNLIINKFALYSKIHRKYLK